MRKLTVLLLGLAVVAGCKYEGSAVQKQYASDRTECRKYAEHMVVRRGRGAYAGEMASGKEHIALVEQFARCMHKRGWAVNKPPEQGEKK